jgi:hypothetical protein
MTTSAKRFKGLKDGETVQIKLTTEQKKMLQDRTGVNADVIVINAVGKPAKIVHVQGHLADDSVIE